MMTRVPLMPNVFEIRVTDVRVIGPRTLWLRFNDGVEGTVVLTPSRVSGAAFARLSDAAYFARARLVDDYTIAWPGGLDLAPEFLYRILRPNQGGRKRDPARVNDARARAYVAHLRRVPEIARFFGIVIHMFWSEHAYPHFHARYGKYAVRVPIGDDPIATHEFPPRQLRQVLEWRDKHRKELRANWTRMRKGQEPLPINPLA